MTPVPPVPPKALDKTIQVSVRHLLAALLVVALLAGAVLWVLLSRPDQRTNELRPSPELVQVSSEPASAVVSSPSLDDSPRQPVAESAPSNPGTLGAEELSAFEKTLFPKERALMAEWGADLETYREYKLAVLDSEAYDDKSLAYALMVHCRAANPEIVYRRMVEPFLRESVDAHTKQSVDQELQMFSTEFNRHRQRLKREYGIDVRTFKSIAERTEYQKRDKAMWQAMDEIVASITCESQLQALLGRPSKGSLYLCLENARSGSR